MKEEKAIVTGDENGNIFLWSIETYLETNQQEDETQNKVTGTQQNQNIINHGTGDQGPITTVVEP